MTGQCLRGDVRLPAIFGDHMVLQRDMSVPVWGTADPGEKVTVQIGDHTATTTTDAKGQWMVKLNALGVGPEPCEMTVTGKNQRIFRDVLVGDVWLCSGQSNMGYALGISKRGKEAIREANLPKIRFFVLDRKVAFAPERECTGKWVVCRPDAKELQSFSSVAFFFAEEVHRRLDVPLGLIGSYCGGSPAQSWVSREALESEPALKYYAEKFELARDTMSEANARYTSEVLPTWKAKVAELKAQGISRGMPREPLPPGRDFRVPTVLFNGMIHPLIPFGIKGALWYQGEANGGKGREYLLLFSTLIRDWRVRWGQGDFPFFFVQMPGYDAKNLEWVELRDSQRRTLSLPNTGMAVTIDIGDKTHVHPGNKWDVGLRLALVALHGAYGQKIIFSGPVFDSMRREEGNLILSFQHVGGGLKAGRESPACEKAGDPSLQAFEVAGADGKFVPAEARIVANTVVVSALGVDNPEHVRYAWTPWPEPAANLYNKEGLPAVPFNSLEP